MHKRIASFTYNFDIIFSNGFFKEYEPPKIDPDEDLRNSRNDEINTFYFRVPEEKKNLKLVIPQILFVRDYKENDIKIAMPKDNKEVIIVSKI